MNMLSTSLIDPNKNVKSFDVYIPECVVSSVKRRMNLFLARWQANLLTASALCVATSTYLSSCRCCLERACIPWDEGENNGLYVPLGNLSIRRLV